MFTARIRRYSSSVMTATLLSLLITPAFKHATSTAGMRSHAPASRTSKPVARSSTSTSNPSSSSRAAIAAPIPDAPPVTSALRGKDDLARALARLDQAVRVGGLLERELGADDRMNRTLAPEGHELVDRLAHDVGPMGHQPAEVEPVHGDVAADEQRRIDGRPRSAGEADRDDRAQRMQQLEAALEELAAHRVDDHVGVHIVELVIRPCLVCTDLTRDLELLRRARRTDDTRAELPRDLHGRAADAPGRRLHQHR